MNKLLIGCVANTIVLWLNKNFLQSVFINFMFLWVFVFNGIIYWFNNIEQLFEAIFKLTKMIVFLLKENIF